MNMEELVFIILTILSCHSQAELVTFPSGEILSSIDPTTLTDQTEHEDLKKTGSYLFNAADSRELSLNIRVADFRSQSSQYFRAHPTFIKCVQATLTYLKNRKYKVELVSGYRTKSDVSNGFSVRELYERSGCGATLRIKSGHPGNESDISRAALHSCPLMFSKIQRDIGVIVNSDSVHIHMTGNDDAVPYFSSIDFGTFNSWARERVDEGIDPTSIRSNCSGFPLVTNGNRFPDWAHNASEAVGPMDAVVTRNKTTDFLRLVQFMGSKVVIPSVEVGRSWCGTLGNPCVDCRSAYVGNAPSVRCANRLMSSRMYHVVNNLQKLVRDKLTDNLKIVKAWNEPYEGKPDGDTGYDELHKEGRMVLVELSASNTDSRLQVLGQLAVCAGADYVEHFGNRLEIAVKKMKGDSEHMVKFPRVELLAVEPPEEKLSFYRLPTSFSVEEQSQYPLHYVKGRDNVQLADNAFVHQFKSDDEDYDYFRLNPRIPECFSAIVYQLNKFNTTEEQIGLDVVRGFLNNDEQKPLFNPTTDKRYNTHTLGVAMQIRYSADTPSNYTYAHLLLTAIHKCAPLFYMDNEYMGIGLYSDSIFIDMRDIFEFWVESDKLIPDGMDFNTYDALLETEVTAAIENRIVDPDDLTEACAIAVLPKKQSPDFVYKEPELTQRKRRRRRAASSTENCVPSSTTEFCTSSRQHRERVVNDIWKEMTKKHIYHSPETDVYEALKGCLLDCGTCQEGDIFEEKEKHCSNLIHWMPHPLLNTDNDVTNFYSRDKLLSKQHACDTNGHECLRNSPALAKLAPSVYALYRPDPSKSPEERLYSSEDNPSPVIQQLEEMFAINAKGVVKFWVENEIDMKSQEAPLRVVMLYNKEVTSVKIYVFDKMSIPAVDELVESIVQDMASTGCIYFTRRVIAPYSIEEVPKHVTKRALRSRAVERIRERDEFTWLRKMEP